VRRLFVVSLWFQLVWLVAVLGQDKWQWVTLVLGSATLVYALINERADVINIIAVGACGMALDYLNSIAGLLVFNTSYIPVWLAVLWLVFMWYAKQWAAVIRQYNKVWVMLFVGCCGALSYWAGYRFSAVDFSYPVLWTLMVLVIQWCCISWLIMRVLVNGDTSSVNSIGSDVTARDKD